MEYPISLYTLETTDGIEWVAEYPDVKGCVGGGETEEEALLEAKENLEIHLQFLKDEGLPIPIPSSTQNEYSGKLTLRVTKTMHSKIAKQAKIEGVSINAYLNEIIAEAIGKNGVLQNAMTKIEKLFNKFFGKSEFKQISEDSIEFGSFKQGGLEKNVGKGLKC